MQESSLLGEDINNTWSAYPRHMCIDQIFKETALKNPHRVAVAYKNETLTYRELDEASDRLANYLVDRGCGREAIVGVCIDRSPDMMVVILAILKAGGAYLPLDMSYPAERLLYMIRHADCRLILGNAEQLRMFEGSGGKLLDLGEHRKGAAAAPTGAVRLERKSSDAAYVMYTSGTTGNPKGVVVRHFNISRLVLNTNYISISQDDVFLQLAPVAFDASTFEIWGALLNGAKLVLYDRPYPAVDHIGSIIREHGVSILWLSAGFFNQVVEASTSIFESVRQLLVGGDVLSVSHVKKVMDSHPTCQVINGYGPTECTTFSVCFRITRESLNSPSLPIGRPISNAQAYILDDDLRPVGRGEAGELFIGGDGLSRGYLGSPELTSERFVEVEHNGTAKRLYRTGDLVRLGDDGNIYFLGRADRQLKVRGYRVEPAEIEAAILSCPGITQAVVAGDIDKQGDKRLIAYIVGKSGQIPGSVELRDMLRQVLPYFMIPATFVYLDRIPLTANGKVDRGLLPKPDWKPLASSTAGSARTPIEKTIQTIWDGVLENGQEHRIHSSILSAGGNDGALREILEKVSSYYGVALDMDAFAPGATTVALLADCVRQKLSHAQPHGGSP